MADNKKYYYMRLKEDFFNSEEIILLESMPDGYLYSNILLKMYLCSLKNEGRLMLNNIIPYNAQMIATVTRHQVGTVEKALDIFEKLGLIEKLDNGAIYMLNIQSYIGKSSTEADRIRNYQRKIASEKQRVEIYEKSTPEIEIEIEKDIDIDIEKDKKKNKKKKTPKPVKHKYGEFKHVLLSDAEYERLVKDYGEEGVLSGIKNVDEYCQEHGKSYQDYNLTLRRWGIKSPKLQKSKPDKNKYEGLDKVIELLDDESNLDDYMADRKNHEGQSIENGYWIPKGGLCS